MQLNTNYNIKKIIVFGIILLIVGGLIGFYFINKKNQSTDQSSQGKSLFPFGDGTSTGTTGNQLGTGGTVDQTGTPIPADGTPIETSDTQKLRQITQYPITNYFPWSLDRKVLEPKLNEKTQQTNLVPRIVPVDMLRWNIKQSGIIMDGEISDIAIISKQKTNPFVVAAEELWWGNEGNTMIFRSENPSGDIQSLVASIEPSTKNIFASMCNDENITRLSIVSPKDVLRDIQLLINKELSLNLVTDGVFGKQSQQALKNFQRLYNIPETGVFDTDTIAVFRTICASSQKPTVSFSGFISKPLDVNILRGSSSPDGKNFLGLISTPTKTNLYLYDFSGKKVRSVFSSDLSEWSIQWINDTTVAITTLASREADGFLFFLNIKDGSYSRILGPIRGLTTLVSPDAKYVLYSKSTDSGIETFIHNTNTGSEMKPSLSTLPAKCVWQNTITIFCGVPKTITPDQYPDSWYQGITSFNDVLWSINTGENSTNLILSPEQNFDMTNLKFSISGDYIYFINKNDQTLWSYRIK